MTFTSIHKRVYAGSLFLYSFILLAVLWLSTPLLLAQQENPPARAARISYLASAICGSSTTHDGTSRSSA